MTASWAELFDRSTEYDVPLPEIRETCTELEGETDG